MRRMMANTRGRTLRQAMMIAVSVMASACALFGQSGGSQTRPAPCKVQYLRLRIATGGDDLRGGKDNLNVTVRFGKDGFQGAANINQGANWGNNTVRVVEIKLNEPVVLDEFKSITLDHLTNGGLTISPETVLSPIGVLSGLKSPDNWDMQSLDVTAVGDGSGVQIVHHGFKRFTGSDPILNIRIKAPESSCNVGERFGRLNPGAVGNSALRPMGGNSGAASKYGTAEQGLSAFQAPATSGRQIWQNNRIIQQALAHTVQIGPLANAPAGEGSYSALLALLRKQSMAARSTQVLAVEPPNPNSNRTLMGGSGGANQSGALLNGGANVALNPQPLPPKSSTPLLGPSQTMSSGTQSGGPSANPTRTTANPLSGPTRHQPNGGNRPERKPLVGRAAPMPTQICRAGIAAVDGAVNGVWFSPVAGQDGQFVIQGCGLGDTKGEVYLSGVQYAKGRFLLQAGETANLGAPMFPDRVVFQIPANGWSDRQIVAQIDAKAGGLYDTNNVTLNVKTANGQLYQLTGMNFLAAREDQTLKGLLPPPGCTAQSTGPACVPTGVNLAKAISAAGAVTPQVESPSINLVRAGGTIAVAREVAWFHFPIPAAPGASFAAGTDVYQLSLAPGFQLDPHTGVQLRHASVDNSYCQSVNGAYSSNGQWAVNYTSTSSFQVFWEEEGCWPKTAITNGNSTDMLNFASVSGYELEITVLGPRGVNPLVNGPANGMVIKPAQHTQLLHKN